MPRTLVISDLHIGCRGRTAVLERSAALERLLAAIAAHDRLVLLGDVVEARPRRALETAVGILDRIGSELGPEREVVFVPGNHDGPLVRRWVRARGRGLRTETEVPVSASPGLAQIVEALAPARVLISYPGVWLAPGIWATHGHYLDQHLFPVSAYGLVRGGRHRLPPERSSPFQYERARRVQLSPLAGWLPGPLAAGIEGVGDLARASTMPRIRQQVLHPRIAPLTAKLLGTQMRRHALPALAQVVHALGVEAEWVVFGHVHRLGPLPGDDSSEWCGPTGRPRLVNTGSWLYEPRLVNRVRPPHPYWPGGAVSLDDRGEPRAIALLDDLAADDLR